MDFVTFVILVVTCVILYIIAKLIAPVFDSDLRTRSSFFAEAVPSEYELPFPDKEMDQFDSLCALLKSKLPAEKQVEYDMSRQIPKGCEDYAWMMNLTETKERQMIFNSLRLCATGFIECAYQAQEAKQGVFKMYKKKVVTEHYWESFLAAETEAYDGFDFIKNVADIVIPGAGEKFFASCIDEWRKKHAAATAADNKVKEKEEHKEMMLLKKINAQKEMQTRQRDMKKLEASAEAAAAQLLAEEAAENKKKNKKKDGKKKK